MGDPLRTILGPDVYSRLWGPELERLGEAFDTLRAERDELKRRVETLESIQPHQHCESCAAFVRALTPSATEAKPCPHPEHLLTEAATRCGVCDAPVNYPVNDARPATEAITHATALSSSGGRITAHEYAGFNLATTAQTLPPDASKAGDRLTPAQACAMRAEGEALRREVERRVAPMKRGPFVPPATGAQTKNRNIACVNATEEKGTDICGECNGTGRVWAPQFDREMDCVDCKCTGRIQSATEPKEE